MPKKGKGKKKGGKGKGDKKKEPPPPVQVEEEPLSELSKEFYLIQIRDLEERVTRYQTKCDTLQSSNDDLQKKLTQQLEDQEHIIALLKKKIQEQSEQCAELDDKLIALKHEKETERDHLMKEISSIREDAQDRLDQLIAENTVLHGTLDSLEEFKANKDKLEADLKSKQEKIEQQKKEFDDKIYQLEKQAVLDKDRMRKEMVAKVSNVAAEFRKVSDLQMADTTKRTIQENVSINQQLHRMSDKTTELVKENERLREREKELCRRLEIMETNERDITRRNISNQKIFVMLKDKVQEQERALSELICYKDQLLETQQQLKESQHTALTTTQQAEVYKADLKALQAKLKELHELYQITKEELDNLKVLMSSAAKTLKASLEPSGYHYNSVQSHQRDTIMSTLMNMLITAPVSRTASKVQLTGHTSYKPGDLGLIPSMSSQTHLPPLQLDSTR